MKDRYLINIHKQFEFYRTLGIKTFRQLSDEELNQELSVGSNSVATIVKHLHGNMLSRFTGFLTSDGEKEWRNRDSEFESAVISKGELKILWNDGWDCVLKAVNEVADTNQVVRIRNEEHTVFEALNRQLAHYAYHVGQIVLLGKFFKGEAWKSLSIPRNGSETYNRPKFSSENHSGHYTDEFVEIK